MAHFRRIKKQVARSRAKAICLRKQVEKVSVVLTYDDLNFESGMCNNGGHYSFTNIYSRNDKGRWVVSHATSADFSFCKNCGDWGSHQDEEGEFICGPPETVSTGHLIEILKKIDRDTTTCVYFPGYKAYSYDIG